MRKAPGQSGPRASRYPDGDAGEPSASVRNEQVTLHHPAVIVIAECPFGGLWFVGVEPPQLGGRTMEFCDLELARDWAARLSEVNGWPVLVRADG